EVRVQARRVRLDEVGRLPNLARREPGPLPLIHPPLEGDPVEDDVGHRGVGLGGDEAGMGRGQGHGAAAARAVPETAPDPRARGGWERSTAEAWAAVAVSAGSYRTRSSSERSVTAARAQPTFSTRCSAATTRISRMASPRTWKASASMARTACSAVWASVRSWYSMMTPARPGSRGSA